MSNTDQQWCLIESDPGVFTELIRGFGAAGVQVEEIYSLMPECFENFKPVHGLIFLFKWVQDDYSDGKLLADHCLLNEIYFAKQVIHNACATQALINILLNCQHKDLTLGTTLSQFKDFTSGFDASLKGMSLSNAEQIRKVHNSFARQQFLEFDAQSSKKEKEDVFHFIGYIPYKGRLLELDGLKEGPYDLGPIPEQDDWVSVARPHIEKRMQKYSEGEIHFNLMAVVSDRKMLYEKQITQLEAKQSSMNNVEEEKATIKAQIDNLKYLITQENEKMHRYKIENQRRKHNYFPLLVELLKKLGDDGRLLELYEKAKQKAIEQQNRKKKQQQLNKKPSNDDIKVK